MVKIGITHSIFEGDSKIVYKVITSSYPKKKKEKRKRKRYKPSLGH